MNSQDVFYVGKSADYVPLNKEFKNISKVHQTHRLDGSDLDGISPLHPYYSRDYRSTSHLVANLAKVRCFSRSPGVCFRMFLRSQEGFSNLWKIMIFHHVWVQKNRPWAKPFDCSVLSSYFVKIYDILTKWILKTYSMWEKNKCRLCTAQ